VLHACPWVPDFDYDGLNSHSSLSDGIRGIAEGLDEIVSAAERPFLTYKSRVRESRRVLNMIKDEELDGNDPKKIGDFTSAC
jgi:hypothetical protein